MNPQGAWSAPIPSSPRSKFAAYEDACRAVKRDPFFDGDWSYDPKKRVRQKSHATKEKAALDKADALESLLGL